MKSKLNCVLLDDDKIIHQKVTDLCKGSSLAKITHSFTCPKEFLKKQAKLDYDVCLLEIGLTELDGLLVAQLLEDKPIIFITGANERLKEAIDFSPVDIVTKPIKKERLEKAFEKTMRFMGIHKVPEVTKLNGNNGHKEFALFNIAEADEKIRLCVSDIFFVTPDVIDPRNKCVIMRNGEKLTLMDCTFESLLTLSPKLVKVNKSELVSVEAVQKFRHDLIILKCLSDGGQAKHVTLNRSFRENFAERLIS